MAKNTVNQIEAIGANLERMAGKDAAQQVMQGSEAIAGSTKPEKVAAWVQTAMERLDRLVDAETRVKFFTSFTPRASSPTRCAATAACCAHCPVMRPPR